MMIFLAEKPVDADDSAMRAVETCVAGEPFSLPCDAGMRFPMALAGAVCSVVSSSGTLAPQIAARISAAVEKRGEERLLIAARHGIFRSAGGVLAIGGRGLVDVSREILSMSDPADTAGFISLFRSGPIDERSLFVASPVHLAAYSFDPEALSFIIGACPREFRGNTQLWLGSSPIPSFRGSGRLAPLLAERAAMEDRLDGPPRDAPALWLLSRSVFASGFSIPFFEECLRDKRAMSTAFGRSFNLKGSGPWRRLAWPDRTQSERIPRIVSGLGLARVSAGPDEASSLAEIVFRCGMVSGGFGAPPEESLVLAAQSIHETQEIESSANFLIAVAERSDPVTVKRTLRAVSKMAAAGRPGAGFVLGRLQAHDIGSHAGHAAPDGGGATTPRPPSI